jgi:hypothetical protein
MTVKNTEASKGACKAEIGETKPINAYGVNHERDEREMRRQKKSALHFKSAPAVQGEKT